MKASEFYEYLYSEKPPKNFTNSNTIHIFGFAEAYVEYLNQGQSLPIDSVSQRSELLAFLMWYDEKMYHNSNKETALQVIDEYKANCG